LAQWKFKVGLKMENFHGDHFGDKLSGSEQEDSRHAYFMKQALLMVRYFA
jgi:hypothetical protein